MWHYALPVVPAVVPSGFYQLWGLNWSDGELMLMIVVIYVGKSPKFVVIRDVMS